MRGGEMGERIENIHSSSPIHHIKYKNKEKTKKMVNSEQFLVDYHSGNKPYSFGGKQHVKEFFNNSNKSLDNILSKSEVYTEYKEFKKPKYFPPIRTYGYNYMWEADLMFFTHPDFIQANEGKMYILAVIDSFTKLVWLRILESKSGEVVTAAMKELFQSSNKPKYLRVDGGGEFINQEFLNMCKSLNVKLYIAMEPIKCAFVERFNRTFKRILVQIMEQNNSIRWIDFVSDALEIYNNRTHSSIGMSPDEARNKRNHKIILRKYLKKYSKFDKRKVVKNKKPTKFKLGQFVKIFKKKGIFSRGYHQNVTKEYFKIYYIDRSFSKDRYYLKDVDGDRIIGSFYEEFLVLFNPSENAEYKLDPAFKGMKRKNINGVPHIFIKWLGWPNKFNQWVPLRDVRHLLPPTQ